MAIEIIDGFDLYAGTTDFNDRWSVFGSPSLSTTSGRVGGGGVTITGALDNVFYYVPSVGTNNYLSMGFAVNSDRAVATRLCGWLSSANFSASFLNAGILLNTDGSVTIEGDGGIDLATSAAGSILASTWHYVEFKIFRDAAGSAEVFVDGVSVVSASGDTVDGTGAGAVFFGTVDAGSGATTIYDDIYIDSDAAALPATLGDVVIETLLPTADTAQADWVLNSGSAGFALIDDALGTSGDGDTTYISSSVLGAKSEFDMGNLSGTPSSIHAVAVSTRASKTDTGTVEYTPYIDSSGTESLGSAINPSEASYTLALPDVFETDPNTGVGWTEAGVNALKLGVEITG